jgi:carboxyl-terminal processing protease
VSALDDPYSDYMTGEDNDAFNDNLNERYEGIGVRFEENNQEVVIVETLPDGPAQEAGIMAGDVLVAVDGQPITNLDLDGIADLILGQAGTSVTLLVDRDGRELIFDIVRRKIFTPLITLKVEGDVGVINVLSFGENLDQEMLAVASDIVNNEQVDKLVLDLRNNGGGVLESAVDLASYFLEPDQVVAQEQTKEDLIEDKTVPKEVSLRRYPLVVLANNGTASASEIVAAALRDHRQVPLIGQTTYGKGLVQQVFRLQDGGYLRLTVAEWLTPNGQQINQKGLEPDMPTSPRQDTLDVVLENYDWEKQNLKQVAS